MLVSASLPQHQPAAVASLPTPDRALLSRLISRDDPTFIACALIAAFSAHYYPRGIDYFPSPEMCMVYGYPLLATGIATFLLRPRSKHARLALLLVAFLSVRTFASLCLSLGVLHDFATWLWNSEPTGYLLLFKAFHFVAHGIGINSWTSEIVFNIVITGCTFALCSQAFSRISIHVAAAMFLMAYLSSLALIYIAAMAIGPNIQVAQPAALFMMLHTIFYWRLASFASMRHSSAVLDTTA